MKTLLALAIALALGACDADTAPEPKPDTVEPWCWLDAECPDGYECRIGLCVARPWGVE